jgi:hypothetical protein
MKFQISVPFYIFVQHIEPECPGLKQKYMSKNDRIVISITDQDLQELVAILFFILPHTPLYSHFNSSLKSPIASVSLTCGICHLAYIKTRLSALVAFIAASLASTTHSCSITTSKKTKDPKTERKSFYF